MFSYWDIYEIIIYQLDVTHVLFIHVYYLQFQLIYIYIIMNVVKFHQMMSVCPAKEQAYYTYMKRFTNNAYILSWIDFLH